MYTIKLKLPQTLRPVTADDKDILPDEDIILQMDKVKNNKIVEGYTLFTDIDREHVYKLYAEINIDNDRLWSLFKALMMTMPEDLKLIIGHKDDDNDELYHSEYYDKYTLYNKLEPYSKEFTQDGFLKFGVGYHSKTYSEEVFISCAKYIQYWGMNRERFQDIMHKYSLYEVKGMEFIDSYPMVTTVLHFFDNEALATNEILAKLKKENK